MPDGTSVADSPTPITVTPPQEDSALNLSLASPSSRSSETPPQGSSTPCMPPSSGSSETPPQRSTTPSMPPSSGSSEKEAPPHVFLHPQEALRLLREAPPHVCLLHPQEVLGLLLSLPVPLCHNLASSFCWLDPNPPCRHILLSWK